MFKKLQWKFVGMIMSVVVVILAAVFACIGVLSYQQAAEQLGSDLNAAIDVSANEEHKPSNAPAEILPEGEAPAKPDAFAEDSADQRTEPPRLGQRPEERMRNPVAVYILTDGGLQAAPRSGAGLDEDALAEVYDEACAAPDDVVTHTVHDLVLLKRTVMGSTFVAFANDSAQASVRSFCAIFAGVGAGALLVFFLISIMFARWALKPVQQAWLRQREFVANASHELKTPLSIIKANTEILLDEPELDAVERDKWLVSTKESTEGMGYLLDEMLVLASMDEASESVSVPEAKSMLAKAFDLSHAVEGIALQFESRAFEGGFSYEVQIEEGMHVQANEDAVAQLVRILVDNACKYVDEGGRVIVRLAADAQTGNAVFAVSNTGEAIPPEKLGRIFERFYRIDGARSSGGGHGLGLAIAKELSDKLNAHLAVTSEYDLTCFSFSLPVVSA